MNELVFLVKEGAEGGLIARALGESIFTEADDWESLKRNLLDAVDCHYDHRSKGPKVILLHHKKF